jgi:SAM-dependent methyltransferase
MPAQPSRVPGRALTHWQLERIGRCRLMDIGAGEGRFVMNRLWDWHTFASDRNGGLTVSAISARHYEFTHGKERGALSRLFHRAIDDFVYRWNPHQSPCNALPQCIRHVNVERLLESSCFAAELAEGFRYDAIVSHRTFEHLQDPLGTVVQLHALLAHGGVLVIDKLVLHGINSDIGHSSNGSSSAAKGEEGAEIVGATALLEWWHAQGYNVAGRCAYMLPPPPPPPPQPLNRR